MTRAALLAAASAVLAFASGPTAAETIAITNARILTMGPAGEIASGTVVLRDGKIVSVGSGAAPAGARVVDARGGVVTPGIVAPDSTLGSNEVSQVPETVDYHAHNAALSAAFDVQYGLNPDSVLLPTARLGGITRAVVTPNYDDQPGRQLMFAGQAAVIHLGRAPSLLVKPKVAMVLELGESGSERAGGARGAATVALKIALDDVRWYMKNRGAYERAAARQLSLSQADLEALIPVVEGRMPVIVGVHRAPDIREVLALAREQNLKIILDGAEQGWMVAGEIAAARVPVILATLDNMPNSFETIGSTMENAARLQKAGVVIAIKSSGSGGHRIREIRYDAGDAVAHGLPYEAAIAAITINPARIFGVADRVGSLEPGKDGDVVVWSGDPLEPLTQPVAIFIRGEQQSLSSRGRELARRYQDRANPYPPDYR
jgi:imidazolonepropionase-like amidohydrolase